MRPLLLACSLMTAALVLGSCAAPPQVAAPAPARAQQLLTVHIDAGTRAADLAQRSGGQVLIFKPEAGFAVLGLPARASALRAQASLGGQLESNLGAFHLTGGALWIDGGALWIDGGALWIDGGALWCDGGALWIDGGALWIDGQFHSMPQNTDAFRQVHLDDAQRGSAHLGAGVEVAVIDSGLDLAHPAFQGVVDRANMHDFVDGDDQPQEVGTVGQAPYGHGTGVAGVVRQVAPNSRILPLRVVDAQGNADAASVAAAVVWAADHGAGVLNLSLGSDQDSPAVDAALEYAAAHGVYATLSAGNRGGEALDYPAASLAGSALRRQTSVSVGSVDGSDVKSTFGSYSPDLGLSAPGEGVAVPAPEGHLALWTGTSFSAPLAAGALALALADRTNGADLVAALQASAADLNGVSGNAAYAHKLGGRLDVKALLDRVTAP